MRLSTTRILTALAILGLGASPAFAALTGYLKIPDIPGEIRNAVPGVEPDEIDVKAADDGARRKNSGEAHLDYLTITMTGASAGGEHEVEYDIAAGANAAADALPVSWGPVHTAGLPTGKRQHRPLTAIKPVDRTSPAMAERKVERRAALSRPASQGAGSVRVGAKWDGCRVGARYPHILLGGGEPLGEYTLRNVQVTECAAEHVSFNYARIEWPE